VSISDPVSISDVVSEAGLAKIKPLRLSGSQPFTQQANVFIMIGERTNVAGSPKFAANPATAAALAKGNEGSRGAEVYDDNCAACHRTGGEGSPKVLPKIAGNPTVLADDPDSLIRLVLAGSALPGTTTAPSPLGMPGFAWRLSNDEVAQLLTFVRSSWGNRASSVSAGQVGRVRASLDSAPKVHASN